MQQWFVQGHPLGASRTLTEKMHLIHEQRPSSSINHGHQRQRTHARCRATSSLATCSTAATFFPFLLQGLITYNAYLHQLPHIPTKEEATLTVHNHFQAVYHTKEEATLTVYIHFQAVYHIYLLRKKTHMVYNHFQAVYHTYPLSV